MSDLCAGWIRVHPALPAIPKKYQAESDSDLRLETVDNSTVGLVDGEITVIGDSYTEITWRWEEDYSCESLEVLLRDVIGLARKNDPDSTFEGHFLVYEIDHPLDTVCRYVVRDWAVIEERPKLVWPDSEAP